MVCCLANCFFIYLVKNTKYLANLWVEYLRDLSFSEGLNTDLNRNRIFVSSL